MKRFLTTLIIVLYAMGAMAQQRLIRSTPESEGVPSQYVKAFFDSLMKVKPTVIHSCIIARHGRVIGELYPAPWKREYSHTMYSVSKTFTAAAVGIAIGDSLLSVTDSVYTYLSEYYPEMPSDTIMGLTIRDLLTMEAGLPVDTHMREVEVEWLRSYLSKQPKALPGELYAYDSIVTYLLSAIVQKVTGQKVADFLKERMFDKLDVTRMAWEESPEGITCGGWGLYIQPETMLKFGQLLLREGYWAGREVIPSWWVAEMMAPQSVTGKYGYQMWQCNKPGWAEANGAYGQHIFVIPETDMVVTLTQCSTGSYPLQKWIDELLVAQCTTEPLVAGNAYRVLQKAKYQLPTIRGRAQSKKRVRSFTISLAQNQLGWEKVRVKPELNNLTLYVTDTAGNEFTIDCGHDEWMTRTVSGRPICPRPFLNNFSNLPEKWRIAASYAWSSDDTLLLRLHYVDFLSSADVSITLRGSSVDLVVRPSYVTKGLKTNGWMLL